MPVVDRYEISIEGLLNDTQAAYPAQIAEFVATLTPAAPAAGTGDLGSAALWPDGFVLTGYTAPIWKAKAYDYPSGLGGRTRLYFHAEVTNIVDGELTEANVRRDARDDFEWFTTSAAQQWYIDLQTKLGDMNKKFGDKLDEQIRIRRFHWYLGDGGGG